MKTKKELAELIISSYSWDGVKSVSWLVKNCDREELVDLYTEACERDYYN